MEILRVCPNCRHNFYFNPYRFRKTRFACPECGETIQLTFAGGDAYFVLVCRCGTIFPFPIRTPWQEPQCARCGHRPLVPPAREAIE
jgi:hypothetical protein